jgi:hypothetical protein
MRVLKVTARNVRDVVPGLVDRFWLELPQTGYSSNVGVLQIAGYALGASSPVTSLVVSSDSMTTTTSIRVDRMRSDVIALDAGRHAWC